MQRTPEALARLLDVRDVILQYGDAVSCRIPRPIEPEIADIIRIAEERKLRQRHHGIVVEPLVTPKSLRINQVMGTVALLFREPRNGKQKSFSLLDPAARLLETSIYHAKNQGLASRIGDVRFRTLMIEDPQMLFESGVRRDVTVLFGDAVGSTGFAEHHSPEIVFNTINEYLATANEAMEAFGGYVDKFMGDGFMIDFNAFGLEPELHAPLAVATGLQIQNGFRIHTDWLLHKMEEDGEPRATLKFRIGIHTGPASVGPIGIQSRINYTAMGTTVNRAQRTEGEGGVPDEVVVTQQVVDACKSTGFPLQIRPVGDKRMTGILQPVPIYIADGFEDPFTYERLMQRKSR